MPEILLALGDREFVNDGSPRWTVEYALRALEMKNATDQVLPTLYALQQSARPVPRGWLGDRLTILWTHFSANRTYVDGQVLTVWLAETMRLLGDLPHDVAALAIDRAVQTSRHGFMPSVGEIRTIAEPIVAERKHFIQRLEKIADAIGPGKAPAQ